MSMLPVAERRRVCERSGCGNLLFIEGPAKMGKFPGHYYFHVCICFLFYSLDKSLTTLTTVQCHACGWHYTLGILEQSPLRLASPPLFPSSAASGVTPVFQVSKCVGVNNKGCKKNSHGSCLRKSCRSCCIAMGGYCHVKGHSEAHLSARQQMKFRILASSTTTIHQQQPSSQFKPTPSASTSMPVREDSPVYFGELGRMLSESNPVVQLKLADECRQRAKQLSDDQELAEELQEEEEHQAVLAAARAPLSSSPINPGPSVTASSASPGPSPSTTFIFSGLPVTRVASSKQPTYTTQMNETWMRKHEDKTKETRRVGGNGQIDLEMVQKFRIIWWEVVRLIPNVHLTLKAYLSFINH